MELLSLPVPTYYHPPICHRFMPLQVYLLYLLLPPNSPGCGVYVHLDVSPTQRSLPLVFAIPSINTANLLPRSPPPPPLILCPRTALMSLSAPRGSTFPGSLPTSSCLHCPHVRPPPFRPWPMAQSLTVPRGLRRVPYPPTPCASDSPSLCVDSSHGLFWWLMFLWGVGG